MVTFHLEMSSRHPSGIHLSPRRHPEPWRELCAPLPARSEMGASWIRGSAFTTIMDVDNAGMLPSERSLIPLPACADDIK